jgi:glutaredoxin
LCRDAERSILPAVLRFLVAWVFTIVVLLCAAGCKTSSDESLRASAPPVVTDASGDLLFTWLDENGGGHVEQKVSEVPMAARETVRVADPARDPPAEHVWVVDLRTPGAGGAYPVRTIKRAEWEAIAIARRDGGALVPRAASSAPPPAQPQVIIYGASWCGPCHQAEAHLKRKGIPYVEKDIEQDSGAAREMQAKLAKAGKRGGSIPVLDVRGQIIIGYDAATLDRALSAP